MRTDRRQASGHATQAKHGSKFGLTQKIREQLKSGPKQVKQLAKILEVDRRKIVTAIAMMTGRTGTVVALDPGTRAGKRYALYDSPEARAMMRAKVKPSGEFAIAGKIEIGRGYRWGAGW